MAVLIDTNIIIEREDNKAISKSLSDLLKLLQKHKVQLLIHPLSKKEISHDKNYQRKIISLSKINTYAQLESPPKILPNSDYTKIIGLSKNQHHQIDNNLLYAVYVNAVEFLITEDHKIINKARKLNLDNRVLNIDEALLSFQNLYKEIEIFAPIALKHIPIHNLSLKDPIFDSLKKDYGEKKFTEWWNQKCIEQVKARVYFKENNSLGAVLILKKEYEEIKTDNNILPSTNRIKIRTLIVRETGQKIGELFLKLTIDYAISMEIDEVYLTHFTVANDRLVALIENFGFNKLGKKQNGEDVYIKYLVPRKKITDPINVQIEYFPSFVDNPNIQKFIIPIQPKFYKRLFIDNQKQLSLFDDPLIVEQNTITKAYISHTNTKKINKGDIVLFYRSEDWKSILTLGTVEKINYGLTNPDQIITMVGKRTVYTAKEINIISAKPTTVLLFRHHFTLPNPVSLSFLQKNGVLYIPQSITKISHNKYLIIKKESKLNEHFTIN